MMGLTSTRLMSSVDISVTSKYIFIYYYYFIIRYCVISETSMEKMSASGALLVLEENAPPLGADSNHVTRKPVSVGFATRPDSNWPAQPQKLFSGLTLCSQQL